MEAFVELLAKFADNPIVQIVFYAMVAATVGINAFANPKPGSVFDKVMTFVERFLSFADRNGRFSVPFLQGERKESLLEEEARAVEDEANG